MPSLNASGNSWDNEAHGGFPARFRRIKERVAARDRQWFAQHPGHSHYVRPYVPGELWPGQAPTGVDVLVLVTQREPGYRTRELIAHVQKRPCNRIDVVLPSSGRVLRGVPMEGVDR